MFHFYHVNSNCFFSIAPEQPLLFLTHLFQLQVVLSDPDTEERVRRSHNLTFIAIGIF